MRMFLTNFQQPVVLRFGSLDLVRGEWRTYEQTLSNTAANSGTLETSAVNIEEHNDKQPVNYVLPPGISRVTDPSQSQLVESNEQALNMTVNNLSRDEAKAVYKNTNLDLRQYKRIQMFVHANALQQNTTNLQNDQLAVFIRLGSDYKNNYYEYEIPLELTPAGQYDRRSYEGCRAVWPEANMLDIDPNNIKSSFTAVYEGFKNAGLRPLDCYVVDDGWTEYDKPEFWALNDKFKEGFTKEAELTRSFSSSFGVWFGPRGGYTSQTPVYASHLEKIGYHKNKLSRDICTADGKYAADLCALMADFCVKYNVRYFKIDGFAISPCYAKDHNHPPARGLTGKAFYTYLWECWCKGFEHIRSVCPDVCLNITSYTHCSPFFLKWADYVWMNNASDMYYIGKGDNLSQCLNYRDSRYRDLFEVRQVQFPAAHLYNHEPCYAERNYNPPLPAPSHKTVVYTDEQFALYLKCCMMRGSGLAEVYFSPSMMDGDKWNIAARTLEWAEKHYGVLSHSEFFGGDPAKGEVYGYIAFDGKDYALMLRNAGDSDKEYSFELPGAGRVSGKLAPFEIKFSDSFSD